MAHKPKITCITATRNRPEKLRRAMESVLSQTIEDFEYIVVDDSDEPVESVVLGFKDERVKYIRNTENPARTHCRPFNIALKRAGGKYIAYLDDDNEWYPYHLEVLLNVLEKGVDVAYCDMMVVQGEETVNGIAMDFDPQFLLNRNFIDTSEIMHKKEVAFGIGGWDEKIKRFTDWNFCVRAMKWGAEFKRVPIIATKYHAHNEDTQSQRTQVKSWYDPAFGMTMFEPTFDPAGCFIQCSYLGKVKDPKVAIFTLTYERLEYTKRMWESLNKSTDYPFDWFVVDQASEDGTAKWLETLEGITYFPSDRNLGISKGSNQALDMIERGNYDIIIKVDNDAEFMTKYWLETLVDLWKRNHKLYMSPYPEGLVHNPGGSPRVGYAYVGPYMVEVTQHIGGFCAFIDAKAYDDFRWKDQFKHGNQDTEASQYFRKKGYMPCYIPMHRVMHMDTTEGQYEKYPKYFERRKLEKTEVV